MLGNSNRPIDSCGSAEDVSAQDFEGFNSEPVTAQPQQTSKIHTQMANYNETNRSSIIGGKPILNYTATYGQNVKPWLKVSNHSDLSTSSDPTGSVVINFDNITEPSTSHSMDFYEQNVNKTFPEKYEQNVSSQEPTRASDNHNSSEHNRDTSVEITSTSRSYSNHSDSSTHSNNNNNNNNNNSSNNNSSNNNSGNSNTSVIPYNNGGHSENANSGNQSIEKILNKYIPFVTFLLMKTIYDHREGILIFVALLVTFIHANYVVKREIAKQSRRSLVSLGIIFINLFVSICFIYFVFKDQHLYQNLIFIPPHSQPLSVWDVLWIVGITDFVLKFITIQLKVGMACFPAKLLPYSARGKWYLMLERTSQLYRGLVPIQPWLYYLTEVYQGPDSSVGMFFSVAYVVSKGSDLKSKGKLFLKAFLKLLRSTSLGVRPSTEQLVSAGSHCPICHDEYNSPIILQCRHVFCESCVSTWFDREQTCPLCRAKIADDPSWRDGATSLFTQLF